jgi:LPS export ABC transporter protein LptC
VRWLPGGGPVLAAIGIAAACARTGGEPAQTATRADSADQVMYHMTTQLTEKGVLVSYVEADTAYLYQNQQLSDLRGLRIRFLDKQNGTQKSVLTARRALYYGITGKLDARGNVEVITTDGRKLRTEHLVYDKTSNRVESDTAFTYESGTEVGSGKRFTSDIEFRNLSIDAPRGFQKGKGILLPGPAR